MSVLERVKSSKTMVSWFKPSLLIQLLNRVIIADVFGQYADRRLIHAALDDESAEQQVHRASVMNDLVPDDDGAVWIDYVADLGDGFDATYAIALLLARKQLSVTGYPKPLPRGGTLIMGGDEVYPTASREDYRERLLRPYGWASPDHEGARLVPVFMVPGNHDWYDGLTNFLAIFCRTKETKIGTWRSRQRRSYFSVQIAEDWWLWGIDIALTADMDQPQADYFVEISRRMKVGSKIILCSAEPGWYKSKSESFRCLDYAAGIANTVDSTGPHAGQDKQFKIVAVLSGDTHHYCRYTSDFGTEFVTSGGGGAFLHGTHHLKPTLDAEWMSRRASTLRLAPSAYPSIDESHALLKKNFMFPFHNGQFSFLVLGIAYWLLGFFVAVRPFPEGLIITFLILAGVFFGYAAHQGEKIGKAACVGVAQAFVHEVALLLILCFVTGLFEPILGPVSAGWVWLFALSPPLIAFGGLVAGALFGANLYFTSRFFDMNHNDAFSSLRLDSHRHFLRLRIKGDQLTIYPIGLDAVPKRSEWKENPERDDPSAPRIVPVLPLEPKLIEMPIEVDAKTVWTVRVVASGQSLEPTTPTATA
jgi:hypothetical protein